MARDAARWRLLDQPHRPCFTAAAGLWAAVAQALVFMLGPLPLHIAGFIATAGPKWLGAAPVPPRSPVPGALRALVGWTGVILAAAPSRRIMAFGLVLAGLGGAALACAWLLCHANGLLHGPPVRHSVVTPHPGRAGPAAPTDRL